MVLFAFPIMPYQEPGVARFCVQPVRSAPVVPACFLLFSKAVFAIAFRPERRGGRRVVIANGVNAVGRDVESKLDQ